MLEDEGRFNELFFESDIAQNLHIQIERAYFSPTENVFKRRLVVSKMKSYCFKACKPWRTGCQKWKKK